MNTREPAPTPQGNTIRVPAEPVLAEIVLKGVVACSVGIPVGFWLVTLINLGHTRNAHKLEVYLVLFEVDPKCWTTERDK
jgi:hypothetical protein